MANDGMALGARFATKAAELGAVVASVLDWLVPRLNSCRTPAIEQESSQLADQCGSIIDH